MTNRNRVQKGVSMGGQFTTDSKPEEASIFLAKETEKPHSFKAAMFQSHRMLTDDGVSPRGATAFLVATAARHLSSQYLEHAKTAAYHEETGSALGYIQAQNAISQVMSSAVKHTEDPGQLRKDIDQAKLGLRSGTDIFRGFGPNPVSGISDETVKFLDDMSDFVGQTHP